MVLDIIDQMIRKLGYKTECFANVHDALNTIENLDFDLIILDYSIPKESGEDNIRRLRDINKKAKIVLLSGYDTSQMDGLIKLGVYDFLQKPVDMKDLRNTISGALKDTT